MAESRQAIEAFVRGVLAAVGEARAHGATTPDEIATALNARGLTTRKGRTWTGAAVSKFLASPGARRYATSRTR